MKIEQLHSAYKECKGITIDSRRIEKGDMFFAFKGEHVNGNEFAEDAIRKGAKYAVIDEKKYNQGDEYLLVDNVLDTLQQLATYHRKQLDIPVIGITGSNGKTTTKELIAQVLGTSFKTFATKGNLNNHIGVPLSLLSINDGMEIAVIEMGANHISEIAVLCDISRPSHGLITNIGRAHLEGFGSIEGVKKAKGELFEFLAEHNGTAFVNIDHEELVDLAEKVKDQYTFGTDPEADLIGEMAENATFVKGKFFTAGKQSGEITSQLTGKYNFENILAAVAVGYFFNVPFKAIKKAVEDYQPKNNRSQIIQKDTNTFILDAYNANPSSMEQALQNFAEIPAKNKVVILGDMMELGPQAAEEHKKIAKQVKENNFDKVIFVGMEFKKTGVDMGYLHFETVKELKKWFNEQNFKYTYFLIKGSRSIELEKLLD